MNNEDIFNTPEQEAVILAGEIREIKEVLRELSRKLSRIEARAKRAFPTGYPKSKPKGKRGVLQTSSVPPSMTSEEIMRVYDEIVNQAKVGKIEQARKRLEEMEVSDLALLKAELGASIGKKKPSKPVLIEAIWGRVNESVMLTKHTNRSQLIEQADTGEAISDSTGEVKS